jgi:4-amino-4-deoxy-L-arabinose transferase-like glycosyltransferase
MVKASKKKKAPKKAAAHQRPDTPDPSLPLEATRAFRWRDRREWLHVGIVLGVALLLRMVFFYFNQRNNPVFENPIMDALYHDEWAQGILDGTFASDDVFFRGPLYPYVLAFFYKLSGSSVAFAVFAQHVIGTLTAGLVYFLSREYFSARVSLLAGLLAALYWPFVYFEGDLLIVSLILFLNTLALVFLARGINAYGRTGYLLLAASGIAFGLSALARPSVLIFFPTLPLVFYWNRREGRGLDREWLVRTAVVAATVVAVIMPVMIRNYVVARAVVPVAASGGVNFYIGNNPASDGSTAIVPGTRADWWGGYNDAIDIAERAEGRELNLSEVSDYFFGRGMDWINSNPSDAATHFWKKFRIFWSGPERANNKFIYFFWNLAGMKYVPLPGFWLITPLALLGAILQWRRRRLVSPLFLFVVAYMVGVVAFFVNARFRLPIVPILIVFAAYGVYYLIDTFRSKDFRTFRAVAIVVVAFVLVNVDYLAFAQIRSYSNAFSHTTLGNAYMKENRRDTALNHYMQAWRMNEDNPTQAFEYIRRDVAYNMGLLYWEKGLCSRAIESLRNVGPAFDGSTDVYMLNALDWLGDCYLRQSNYDGAYAVYQEFLRVKPDDVRAITGMARLQAASGNLEEAERMLRSVVDPTSSVFPPAYIALAEIQRSLGKTQEAIASYSDISKYTGYEKDALVALAELYQETGNVDAALQTLRRAANYFPLGDPTIRNWITRLQSQR